MPPTKRKSSNRKKFRLVRVLGNVISILLIFIVFIGWLISLPQVQTFLVSQADWALERKIGSEVSLEEVSIALPDKVVLEGLKIEDESGNALLKMRGLRLSVINFSLWNYLFVSDTVAQLKINGLELDQPEIDIYKDGNGRANFQFILDAFAPEKKSESSQPVGIRLSDFLISEGKLSYCDSSSTAIDSVRKGRFIHQNFRLQDLELQTSLSLQPDDEMELDLGSFSAYEHLSGLNIPFFSFLLENKKYSEESEGKQLDIKNLRLRTRGSNFKAQVSFPRLGLMEFLKDPKKLGTVLDFEMGSILDFSDLSYFLGDKIPIKGRISLSGRSFIDNSRILSENLRVAYGRETRILGKVNVYDYQDIKRLRINASLQESRISLGELQELVPLIGLPKVLQPIKQLQLEGSMVGKLDDFQVDVGMDTDLGRIAGDLHMVLLKKYPKITYEGKILTENLNLNGLGLEKLAISKNLNVKGNIKGEGLDLKTLDAFLDVQINDSDIMGYQVDSAASRVEVAKGKVDGKVFYRDREGIADVDIDLRLDESPAQYKVDGRIENINLQTYGLYAEPVLASSEVHINIKGDSIDNLSGEANLLHSRLFHSAEQKEVRIPDLFFQAQENSSTYKYFNLKSSLVDADLAGTFSYAQATDLLERLYKEIGLYFANDDSAIQAYYATKVSDSIDLKIQMGIATKDSLSNLLDFFKVPVAVAPGTFLSAYLLYEGAPERKYREEKFNLDIEGDSITYRDFKSYGSFANLKIVKSPDRSSFKIDAEVDADSFGVGPAFTLDQLSIRSNLQGNSVQSSVNFKQRESRGIASFAADTRLRDNGDIYTTFDSASALIIHGDTLTIDQDHNITINGSEVYIENLVLQNDERYYRVNGSVSEDINEKLELQFNRFDLTTINEFYPLQVDVAGFLGGTVTARALLDKPIVELGARISAFEFEGYPYGNIFTRALWSQELNIVDLGTYLIQSAGDTTLNLRGSYSLIDKESPMNFKLESQSGIPLDFVSPFVAGELYNLEGNVDLNSFTITGNLNEPIVLGRGKFREAGFGISYFQTAYRFDGSILFDNQHMNFENIAVTDRFGNVANLYGDIRHRGFQEFTFNLQLASAKNFLLMDTDKSDNSFFYGKLLLDEAFADITGNLKKISVLANTSFAPGSELNLPVNYKSEFNRPDYILFKGEEEQGLTAQTDLLGFDLNFTAYATEDLEVNIIFDERVGDIIRARGEGSLGMYINESGTFSMEGDYTIMDGDYLFTMENLINKKFVVTEGSTLSWDGDPFDGNIDIDAIYATLADISAIDEGNNSRVLTHVMMHMEGPLMQPEISLEIRFPGVNATTASSLVSYINSINEFDEQELNNQVFSLIVFNRFAPQGSLAGSDDTGLQVASDAVATTLSELLNNQLNYWVSRATGDKLNVNLNTGVDRNIQNDLVIDDVNLQVSAKLFGDRVTIERDGNLLEKYSTDNIEGIIGNISLTIRLLPGKDGGRNQTNPSELVLEVFGRQDILEQEDAYQTGVGLFYKKDLNKLSQIFKRKAREEQDNVKQQEPGIPDSLKQDDGG